MAVTNYGPHDSRLAAADYSAKQYYLVVINASNEFELANANTDLVHGSIANKPKAGEVCDVMSVKGGASIKCIAGGTIAKDALLMSDANGKAVTATTGKPSFGRAMEAAVANDIFQVLPVVLEAVA